MDDNRLNNVVSTNRVLFAWTEKQAVSIAEWESRENVQDNNTSTIHNKYFVKRILNYAIDDNKI